jgi:hypothetical protein
MGCGKKDEGEPFVTGGLWGAGNAAGTACTSVSGAVFGIGPMLEQDRCGMRVKLEQVEELRAAVTTKSDDTDRGSHFD